MDKSTDNSGPAEDDSSKKVDLSALQNFNFATNWSESSAKPSTRPERGDRPRGGDRRGGGDRRPDRRPPESREGRPARDRGERRGPPDRREGGRPARGGPPPRGGRREEPTAQALLRESPFEVQIFPEEPILVKLTQAMRHSLRTYELFEVSRLVLEKPDRYQIGLKFRGDRERGSQFFQSVPDGVPFLSEEAAIDHVYRNHLDRFFTVEEVEVEAPKGNFQFVARCNLTGDVLGPPNYHRYQAILLEYHQERFSDMPFDRFRSHIETVKDEEAVQKWLESMTKQTRYKIVGGGEGEEKVLETPEEARSYLIRQVKDKVVHPVKTVRFPGGLVEKLPSDVRPYAVAYVELQKRFPLDTANTLRGRLRRQHFFIYKKGSKGVSLVCAVKRKFRQPNQVFSDSVQRLIEFLEKNDQIHASELSEKLLGIPTPQEGESAPAPDAESQEKVKRLGLDLRWLLSEGYVTEYSDGRLSMHPIAEPGREEPAPKPEAGADKKPEEKAEEPVADTEQSEAKAEEPVDGVEAPASPEVASESPSAAEPIAEETPEAAASPAAPPQEDQSAEATSEEAQPPKASAEESSEQKPS